MKKTLLFCVVSALLGGLLSLALTNRGDSLSAVAQEKLPPSAPRPAVEIPPSGGAIPRALTRGPASGDLDEFTPEERVNIAVYENCNRAVVNINTRGYHGDRLLFMEMPSEGAGSGAVIDRLGHVLTNYHVIEGAETIQVVLFNSKAYAGRVVGKDPDTDIAVLKIDAPQEELFPVVFGDSSRLRVGQKVYALGNPFGLARTLSTGIVSSLDRQLPRRNKAGKIAQIIQIDASINPGNSGGPLLDSHGRMIGMNTAIASKTGESAGVGFAIPIGTIARVVPQLIRNGRVIRPESGIANVYQTEQGLQIAALLPASPAERAGLQGARVVRGTKREGPFVYQYQTIDRSAADVIVGIDGRRVKTVDDFLGIIESKQPGDQVIVHVIRGGREVAVPVKLGATE